jgi:prostaglandin-H2 D-isomerase / glutathione transferase
MTTPTHELIYFDMTGRGEPVRILLHSAGVQFTDTRIKFADWGPMQPTTPLGALPILKVDGTAHVQSVALMRYAAKLAGFYPTQNPLEALVVDEVLDSCNELLDKIPSFCEDKEALKKLRTEFQEKTMTQYASFLERIVAKNKETFGSSLVVGTTVTVADIFVNGVIEAVSSGIFDYLDKDFFKTYPGLLAVAKAVDENEKVKMYNASKK